MNWFEALVRASWQGAIALAVVWLVSRFIPGISPACKVWLWRLAFLKMLIALLWLSPITVPVLPNHDAPTMAGLTQKAPPPLANAPQIVPEGRLENVAPETTLAVNTTEPKRTLNWQASLFLLWAVGVGGFAVRFIHHWRAAKRLIGDAQPLRDPKLGAALDLLCKRLAIRRTVLLYESASISSPLLVGLLCPRVVLPKGLYERAGLARLELMLAHELAHVRRNDLAWLWLFTITEAIFFFHPLVWLTRREWTLVTESACDELAVRVTRQSAQEYGEMLIHVVASGTRERVAMSVGIFDNANTLKRRLKSMITTRTRLGQFAGIMLIAAAAIALAPWKLVAQAPNVQPPSVPAPNADAEALARLRAENEKLRAQLEATHADAERLRKRVASVDDLEKLLEMGRQHVAALEKQGRGHGAAAQANERRIAAIEKAQVELAAMQTKFSREHPEVKSKQAELAALQKQLEQSLQVYPGVTLEAQSKTAMGSRPMPEHVVKHHEQQRNLLWQEIELAEKQVKYVQKNLEVGKENPASLLAAQREVLDLKLQLARLGGSKADQRAVLLQQLSIAESLLKEQQQRIKVGTVAPDGQLMFEREVLRIKRELYALDAPDLRN